MSKDKATKEILPDVTTAEWEVMKVLWKEGPSAARDVYAALPKDHSWAYNTLKTLLSRLVAKGALGYEQVGNSYLYRAIRSQEQLTRKEIRGFLSRVADGSLFSLVANFVEGDEVSTEELQELRQLLDAKLDGKKDSSGRKNRA